LCIALSHFDIPKLHKEEAGNNSLFMDEGVVVFVFLILSSPPHILGSPTSLAFVALVDHDHLPYALVTFSWKPLEGHLVWLEKTTEL